MNQDKEYMEQIGFDESFQQAENNSDSDIELFEVGEEGSKFSFLQDQKKPENDIEDQMNNELMEPELQEILESLDIKNDKTTKIDDFQTTKKERNIKDNPKIYEKLTQNLLKCSAKWYNVEQKLKEIQEFNEMFLETFSFSLYYKSDGKTLRKFFKNEKYIDSKNKNVLQKLKTLIYTPEVDIIFINSKDVYIDIEISQKNLYIEIMDEFWTHMLEICKEKNLCEEFSIVSEQSKLNDPKTKRLIIERATSIVSYKIILRPTKELKKDLNFFDTQLVSTYARVDNRFRILAAFLTIWANKRGILLKNRIRLNDLYQMLIFFFLHNKIMPSLQTEFKVPEKMMEIYKKSNKTDQEKWRYTKRQINLAFEQDVTKVKTQMINNEKANFTVGELLGRFFFFFGVELPKMFIECQNKQHDYERQKYILLNIKNGKVLTVDNYIEIENIITKKVKDRNEIDKGYFLMDPFLGEIMTKHVFGRLTKEKLVEKIKEFIYDNPYENLEFFFKGHNYEKLEIEFFCAYKRILQGNGRDIFDDVDYKELQF